MIEIKVITIDEDQHHASALASVFLGAAFLGAALFAGDFLVAVAVVFATRPDFVFVSVVGLSTTAGALCSINHQGNYYIGRTLTEAGAVFLLDDVLAVAFGFAVVVFLVLVFLTAAGLVAVFLVAGVVEVFFFVSVFGLVSFYA